MMFKGKVVAITGAAGGIGQILCRYFAGEGASISAIDKSAALVDFAAELAEDGVAIRHAIVDVGDSAAVAKAFAAFETADVLINNAGFSEHPTFAKTDPEAWRHDINGNLNGAYYCAMRDPGNEGERRWQHRRYRLSIRHKRFGDPPIVQRKPA